MQLNQPPWGRERDLEGHEHVRLQLNPPGEGSADLKVMFMSPFTPPIMPSAASCDEGSPGRPRPQRTPDLAARVEGPWDDKHG